MDYRLTKQDLLDTLSAWNRFLKRKVHMIACGGTALTLMDIKESTKDVDFLVPVESEYDYLIKTLAQLGYKQQTAIGWAREAEPYRFDLFRGKLIHTTELLNSPLEEKNHQLIQELEHLYIGALNYYDLIISKLFRATSIDIDDCVSIVRAKHTQINIDKLNVRFHETAKYDTSEERVLKNLEHFHRMLKKENLYGTQGPSQKS